MSSKLRLILAALAGVGLTVLLSVPLPVPWLLSGALGFGTFIVGYNMLPRDDRKRLPSRAARKALRAHPQYEDMMKEAARDMETLEEARRKEREPEVRREIAGLLETGGKITDYLARHPEAIPSARRFFTYYLQTAVTVLEQREQLAASGLERPEIRDAKKKAEAALPKLNEAFEAQLSSLMTGQIVELEAEAKLLETAMRMDAFHVDKAPALPESASAEATKEADGATASVADADTAPVTEERPTEES